MLDEVVDLDDQWVLDGRQELLLRLGCRAGVLIAGVEQALQHHPAVGDVAVAGEVDPAHAAVGEGALDLVLAGDEFARRDGWMEVEGGAAFGALALDFAGFAIGAASDRFTAVGAVAPGLRDDRVGHHGLDRVDGRCGRHRGDARTDPGARPVGVGADRPSAGVRADQRRSHQYRSQFGGRRRGGQRGAEQLRRRGRRLGIWWVAAVVAVAVDDGTRATGLGAPSAQLAERGLGRAFSRRDHRTLRPGLARPAGGRRDHLAGFATAAGSLLARSDGTGPGRRSGWADS